MSARATRTWQAPVARGRDLVVAAPDLGRDERQPERVVDRVLAVGDGRLPRATTARRDPAASRARARARRSAVEVPGRAGQVQQRRAGLLGRRKADAHLDAIEQQIEPARAPVQRTHDVGLRDGVVDRRSGIDGGRDDLDVADRVLPAPERADRRSRRRRRAVPRAARQMGAAIADGAAERNARDRGAQVEERGGDRVLDHRVESGHRIGWPDGGRPPRGRRPRSRRARDAAPRAARSSPRPIRRASGGRPADRRAPTRGAPTRPRRTCAAVASGLRGRSRSSAGGGDSRKGPRSASDSMLRSRTSAAARPKIASSDRSPRIVASAASSSSVLVERNGRGSAGGRQESPASLSVRRAQAGPGAARLSFRSAGSRPASRRCRP